MPGRHGNASKPMEKKKCRRLRNTEFKHEDQDQDDMHAKHMQDTFSFQMYPVQISELLLQLPFELCFSYATGKLC